MTFLQSFSNDGDTIKIFLKINNELIKDPSKKIILSFKTRQKNDSLYLQNDLALLSSPVLDSTEIIVIYKNSEIGRCFKYGPGILTNLEGLAIEVFTSKKEIRKSLLEYAENNTEEFGKIKSMCIISTHPKRGDGTTCTIKNWTQK